MERKDIDMHWIERMMKKTTWTMVCTAGVLGLSILTGLTGLAQSNFATTIEQRMDSLVRTEWDPSQAQWVATLRENYVYNGQDQLTQAVKQSPDMLLGWNTYWEENFSYASSGLMTGYMVRTLDSITNQLKNYWKEEYTYNTSGDITLYSVYEWGGTPGQWNNSWKAEYTYDATGNLLTYQDFYWSSSSSQWVNSWKAEYTYTNGLLSQYLDYYWNSGSSQWVSSWKAVYSYTSGSLSLYQDYTWTGSAWANSGKKEYTYTAQGKESTISAYSWKASNSTWTYLKKEEFSYDPSGNLVQYLIKGPNQSGTQWVNLWKEDLTYSGNAALIKVETADWQNATSQWTPAIKQEYQYDTAYSVSGIVLPFWYHTNRAFTASMLTGYQEFSFSGGGWIDVSANTFYYSALTPAGLTKPVAGEFSVYPNPARDVLNISWPEGIQPEHLELLNIKGQTVWSTSLGSSHTLSLPSLRAGVYFFRLSAAGINTQGRLLIQK